MQPSTSIYDLLASGSPWRSCDKKHNFFFQKSEIFETYKLYKRIEEEKKPVRKKPHPQICLQVNLSSLEFDFPSGILKKMTVMRFTYKPYLSRNRGDS